jgi:hypothetical protein
VDTVAVKEGYVDRPRACTGVLQEWVYSRFESWGRVIEKMICGGFAAEINATTAEKATTAIATKQ